MLLADMDPWISQLIAVVTTIGSILGGQWVITWYKEWREGKNEDSERARHAVNNALDQWKEYARLMMEQDRSKQEQLSAANQRILILTEQTAIAHANAEALEEENTSLKRINFIMQKGCESGCPLLLDPTNGKPPSDTPVTVRPTGPDHI